VKLAPVPHATGRRLVLLAALLATADTACGEGYAEPLSMHAGAHEREALLWRPAGDFRPERLVVMLHGAGGDPERIRLFTARGLERAAMEGRWLVVYPAGVGGTWNDCRRSPDYPARREGVDDVGFLAELVTYLRARFAVPAGGVLAAGFSNGAHMALRLAVERPELVDGLVMVAAQLPADAESLCPLEFPSLHLLHITGTEDPFAPFGGGSSVGPRGESLGLVQSADDTVRAFVAAAGGATVTRRSLPERDDNPDTSASLAEWLTQERVIRQYVLHGAGHVVPQRTVALPSIAGASAGDVDFGEAVLEFVSRWPEFPRNTPGPRTAER
jgi:polyhydroxybutyrate depolymerase